MCPFFCVLLLGEAMVAQTGSIQPMSASFRGAKNILIVSADTVMSEKVCKILLVLALMLGVPQA